MGAGVAPMTGMTPVYADGMFAWLHDVATPPPGARVGVVLCPAFAQEEVCTHHGLMALADRCAAAGMPTIRFDYRGTGDSVSDDVTLNGLVDDTAHAAAVLRQACGVGTVVLIGVRLGAAIATLAAARIADIGALVLMGPVSSGHAFMRETRASASVASLSGLDPVPPADSDLPLNTNGFAWSAALQRAVGGIDIVDAPAVPTLILPARGDRRAGKLAALWRAAGTPVTETPFADYEAWMQDPTTNATPVATFAGIGTWLAALDLSPGRYRDAAALTVYPTLNGEDFVEEPIRFGPGNVLSGILCRPRATPAGSVAALLLHEGSTHHIGNGRAYVVLARRLAAAGHASLRMDLTGMGDSPAGDNPRHPHYDPERIAEGVAGLDALAAAGFDKAVAFGLCSGAHTALQVTLADDRVVGNVVVNLQKFIWHYGDDIRVAVRDNKRSFKAYVRAMRNPGEWRRALSGEADLKGIARVLAKRSWARTTHAVRGLLPPAPGSETAQVRDLMRRLADRGVHTHLIYADEDPGLAEMAMQFGRKARRLGTFAPARLVLLDHADHHFNGSDVRRRYYDLAIAAMADAVAAHGRAGVVPAPVEDRSTAPAASPPPQRAFA